MLQKFSSNQPEVLAVFEVSIKFQYYKSTLQTRYNASCYYSIVRISILQKYSSNHTTIFCVPCALLISILQKYSSNGTTASAIKLYAEFQYYKSTLQTVGICNDAITRIKFQYYKSTLQTINSEAARIGSGWISILQKYSSN